MTKDKPWPAASKNSSAVTYLSIASYLVIVKIIYLANCVGDREPNIVDVFV